MATTMAWPWQVRDRDYATFTMGHTVDRKAVAEAAAEVSCPGAAAASAYIGAADLEAPFMASLLSEFYTPLSSQPALCFYPTLFNLYIKK